MSPLTEDILVKNSSQLQRDGFTIVPGVFSEGEVGQIILAIEKADNTNANFRKSKDLFAIRQFLKEIPEARALIFNDKIKHLIERFFGSNYSDVKSIYFDKPEQSNWFVSYHHDLRISVGYCLRTIL